MRDIEKAGKRIAEMHNIPLILASDPLPILQQAAAARAAYDQALRELRVKEMARLTCLGS